MKHSFLSYPFPLLSYSLTVSISAKMLPGLQEKDWSSYYADLAEAEHRLILETDMPNMLQGSSKYNEKELKTKTRRDHVLIEFKKEKEQKHHLYEATDTDQITKSPNHQISPYSYHSKSR